MRRGRPPRAPASPVPARHPVVGDVAQAIEQLRQDFEMVVNHFRLGLASRLAHVEDALHRLADDGDLSKSMAADLELMKLHITGLCVNPRKGRRRDLRRIARIALRLEKIVDAWE